MDVETLIYVKTKNDVNGNPRRGWIVTWMDNKFIDEGYAGRYALYRFFLISGKDGVMEQLRLNFDHNVNEITLDITASQYNRLKRGK